MRKPQLFDVIKLKAPASEHGLPAGKSGTIVEVYGAPREAYEVEFLDEDGYTLAVFPLTPDEFEVTIPWEAPVAQEANA